MKNQIILTLTLLAACVTGSFSQGVYIEFKMSSSGGDAQMSGSMKAYYQDGNSHSEISMVLPQMPGGGGINIVSIIQKETPTKVYMLDEKNKTYSETELSTDEEWKDYPQSEYEVTVIGKEKVNNYNTTHVSVTRKGSKGAPEEFWTTTEVADFDNYTKIKSPYTGKDNMMKAMEAKGAKGFPVRIKTQEHGYNFQMDLVKVEKRSNPASLFSLEGYKKSSGASVAPMGIDVQQIMKDVQNMTPEERDKYIKQMQEQYKPH